MTKWEEYEKKGRELCKFRGVNPDEKVSHAPEPVGGIQNLSIVYSPAWILAAKEVEQFEHIQRASNITSHE